MNPDNQTDRGDGESQAGMKGSVRVELNTFDEIMEILNKPEVKAKMQNFEGGTRTIMEVGDVVVNVVELRVAYVA